MDDALLKVVQASNVALHRLTGDGYDFEDSNLKRALDELEKLEDEFLQSIVAAADSAGEKIRAPWERVLKKTKVSGTATGAQVASTLRDYAKRAQAAMRAQRETGFKTAYLLTQNFAILASGILIGMSEGLGGKPAAAKRKAKATTGRKTTKSAKRAPAKSTKRAPAKTARRPSEARQEDDSPQDPLGSRSEDGWPSRASRHFGRRATAGRSTGADAAVRWRPVEGGRRRDLRPDTCVALQYLRALP